jgi:type IV fimbrial biogenesis protein FimT
MARYRGFTLLELMVTVAVLSILLTLGVPAFGDLVRNNRIATQANQLVAAINIARSEAVKRGRNVQVSVVAGANGAWSAEVRVVGAADPVRVVAGGTMTVDAATVVFRPTGVPAATTNFAMQPSHECSGQQRRQIAVTASGQVRTTRQACV